MCPLKSSEQSNEDNKQRYSETKRGEIKAHLFPGRIVRNGRGQRQKRNVPRAQTMGPSHYCYCSAALAKYVRGGTSELDMLKRAALRRYSLVDVDELSSLCDATRMGRTDSCQSRKYLRQINITTCYFKMQ